MTTTKTTTPAPTYGELSDNQRGRVRYVYNVRHAGETVNHGDRADEYDAIARELFGTPAPTTVPGCCGIPLPEGCACGAVGRDARAADANAAHAARWGITDQDDDTDAAERDEWDAADDRNED